MKINRSIPGQMSDAELNKLMEISSNVPSGGVIVEVGCLYGLSSWHISKAARPDVTIFCIDPWERAQWIVNLVEKPQNAPPFGIEAFSYYTSDCDNIVKIKGYSPQIAAGWNLKIDMYFEDAIHTNPVLGKNLDFWGAHIKKGGVASGHDYCLEWPDVILESNKLAKKFESYINVIDTLWFFQKNKI